MKPYVLKSVWLSALSILMTYSCLPQKTYKSRGMEKDCKPYYDYIRKNYVRNDKNLFEYKNPPRFDTTLHIIYAKVNKPCIIGLTKRQVKRLFGKPSFEDELSFHYYERKECFQEGKYRQGCARLKISFDENGKVADVKEPYLETLPIPMQKE